MIWNGFLIAVMVAAAAVAAWSNDRIWKRVRESGHRYWAINPRAYLAGLRGFEMLILTAATLIGLYALRALSLAFFPHS
ncbi:hypothetical protein [Bradyrhizobium guangzhouense]|nr:hypothetical protein [Bradyrhizobium guangzhouense]